MRPILHLVSPLIRPIMDRLLPVTLRFIGELNLHQGLTFVHVSQEDRTEAIEKLKAAIDLIELSDPRRFARLTRVVHFVCSGVRTKTWAVYSPHSKIAIVNVARVSREMPEWRESIETVAALLVSASVDGLLHEKGISRSKRNKAKIDRLKRAEMARFRQRVVNDEARWQDLFPPDVMPDIFQGATARSLAPLP